MFFIFTNGFICDEFMRAWEVPATSYQSLQTYDAGIVLGGVLSVDPDLDRIQFYRGADRLFQAIELYRRGIIKKIVFSGGSGMLLRQEEKEGTYVRRYLLDLGVPERDILIENSSRNTRENALFTKSLLDKELSGKKFLLITSGMHMRRALQCFSKAGINVKPYSTDRYSGPRKFEVDHLFIPNAFVLEYWDVLIHEYIGFVSYKIVGYI